jgi:hypothetical protein
MVTLKEVNEEICRKIENVELKPTNIAKMLDFDEDIGGIKYHAYICLNKIYNYGLDDEKCNITFEEYLNSFKSVCDWGIAGGGACEEPETILKKFNDLNLTFKEVDKMNVKEIFDKMTKEDKKEMIDLFFKEEVERFFKNYDHKDGLIQEENWQMFQTRDGSYYLEDDLFNSGPRFAPLNLAYAIQIKWVAKYHFAECLKDKGCEQTRKAIEKAIPGANIVIVTPEVLEEVLVLEVKEKIIDELI